MSEPLTAPQPEPEQEAPVAAAPVRAAAGRRRRLALLVSAVLLLLGGLVVWASQRPWVLGRVGEEVASSVTASMEGGRMRLGGLSGSLLGPIELTGVALEDDRGVAVVKVAKVRLDYHILPLLSRRLVVTELAVEGFEADGVIEADGGLNLGRLFKASPASASRLPMSLSVEALKVAGSSLSIRDGRNGLARVVALRELALAGSATVSREWAAAFELERLGLRWRVGGVQAELPLELRQMSLISDTSGLRAVVSRLAVSDTELWISCACDAGDRARCAVWDGGDFAAEGEHLAGTCRRACPRGQAAETAGVVGAARRTGGAGGDSSGGCICGEAGGL